MSDTEFLQQRVPRWSPVKVSRWRGLVVTIVAMFASIVAVGGINQHSQDVERANRAHAICAALQSQTAVLAAALHAKQPIVDAYSGSLSDALAPLGCHIHVTVNP